MSPWLTLSVAVLFVSFGAILVRLAAAPALAVSFYRVFLASVLLLPFAARPAWSALPALGGRRLVLLAGAGLALALHFATWIASLSHTTVAASVLLVNTAPLFAIVLSRLFLGEAPSRAVQAATPVAFAGAALIALDEPAAGGATLLGNALAVAGAVTLAAYQVVGRGLRHALPLHAYVLGVWASAAAFLAVLAAATGVPLHGFQRKTWLAFLALALVPTLGGHGLVNKSLRALPAPTVGLFLLGEPVIATLLAALLFGEVPGPRTLAGGAVVLAALGFVLARRG